MTDITGLMKRLETWEVWNAGDDLHLGQKATIKGATVLPSSVKPCSSNTLPNHEDTGLSKTPRGFASDQSSHHRPA